MALRSKKKRYEFENNENTENEYKNGQTNEGFDTEESSKDMKQSMKNLEVLDDKEETNEKPKTKKNKSKGQKSEENVVSVAQLFRYADFNDKIMILIGTLAALLSAGIYPLIFLLYGRVAGTLVDFSKDKVKNSTAIPFLNNSCFVTSNDNSEDAFNKRINSNVVFYISAGFASLVLNYVACACWSVSAERQIKRIRNLLFRSILRQEIGFFDKNTPGDLNSRITSNITTLQDGLGYKFADTITMMGRGIACAILALVQAIKFSAVFLGLAPIIGICTAVMVIMIKKYTVKEFKAYGKAGVVAQEALSAIRTVYAFGFQTKAIKNYSNNLKDAEAMSIKKGFIIGIFLSATMFLFNSIYALAMYYGVYLIRTDCVSYSPSGIMQSLFCMVTTTFAIGQALPFLKDLSEARAAASSVFQIIEKKSTIDYETKGGQIPNRLVGNIEFENVNFSYPQRADLKILKNFKLQIPAGRTVALCGKSGGGKSTVIQLLERFYDPDSGEVKIDGVNIKDLDVNWLRDNIALVQQEPVLFATSIRENIRLGRLDATDQEIEEVVKIANAHNFIMNLKDGYDTLVGERGSQISGGQKQRIAIARALIRNPKILLLDEATSALDLESEKMVQDALDKAKIGRTTIIVAHRLSTIRNADLIVGIANGQVEETGTHDELMDLQGIYYELVTMQTKEVKEHDLNENESEEALEEKIKENEDDDIDSEQEVEDDNEFEKPTNHSKSDVNQQKEKHTNTTSKMKKFSFFKLERLLFKLNKPEILYLIIGTIGQIVNSATFPATALVFNEIYTVFALPDPKEQEKKSLEYMGYLLGIAGITIFATLAYMYSFAVAGARLTRRLRGRMFKSMMKQEIGWFDLDENRSSVLAARLSASVPLCKGLTVEKLNLFSQGLSGFGFAVIFAFVINWKLAFVMLTFVPITFASGIVRARAMLNTNVKGKTTVEEGGKITTEVVENIRTVVSLGRQDYFLTQFKAIFNKKFKKSLWRLQIQSFFYSLSNSLLFFIQASAFGYGYTLVRDENLRVADMYKIYITITFSTMTLGRVFSQMPDQNKAVDATKAAFKIIQRQSKIDSLSDDGIKPSTIKGEIEFRDVHFRYPTRKNKILKGLNLKVNPGETNALVGQSGCGKSTTVQLLLRFYDVDKGQVLLDGVDIRELNVNWLRSQIGLVSQEPVLFNLSILENIEYGDIHREKIPIEEIMDVALQANIHNKIQLFPDKYNTIVGTKGGQLSGGEKQRVAIARALLRKPKILLLDEATSALDTQSEEVVQDALDRAQKGRTCICIAHRLSTIQDAEKISVFKNGRVVEEGSHAQLMDRKDVYYNLQLHAVNPT